ALVSIVVLVGVVGYFAIPAAARWGIETVASREIGRSVRVDSIRANPYTMRLTINGLTVDGAPGEAAPLLTVQQTTVNASISSLLRLAPIIDAVSINGIAANIVRLEAQRFNFDDIIERLRAKPKTDDEPARFAVHNIEVADSSVQFDDRVGGRKHAVTDIAIGIPFISNLPVDAEVKVLPAFSARINGSPLVLKGETRPFHQTLESSIDLKVSALDIAKYLSFAPVRLNFNVDQGALDTDLRIAFRRAVAATAEQKAAPAQTLISGVVAISNFGLSEKSPGTRLLGFKTLRVMIDQLDPFARRAVIGDVQLDGADLSVVRSAAGELNWIRFGSQALGGAPAQSKPAPEAPTQSTTPAFALTLKHAALNGGRVDFVDETVSFRQEVINIAAEASALSNTPNTRGAVRVAADLKDNGSVSLDGELGIAPLAGRLKYGAKDVKLRAAARYLANLIDATVDGSSDVSGLLEIASSEYGLQLALREVAVVGTGISVHGPASQGAALDIARFAIEGGEIDLVRRAMTFTKVSLDAPRALVRRLPDGTINWSRVPKRPAASDTRDTPRATPPSAPSPWSIAVREAELARGDVQFEDRATEPAVKLRASAIAGTVRNIVGDGSEPAEFALRTRFGSGGTLAVNGNARWDAPSANVRVDARNLDVAALRPYVAARLNGVLASAEVSGKGTLTVSKPKADAVLRAAYSGSARLSNFHALDGASNDLLRWQALDIDKLAVKVGEAPPVVDLGKITLNDFFARVIVSEQGRLNLLDVVKRDATPASATAPPAAPATE
ncbi:MAG: DUF748 domain-containing protein, partial [Burkholderiaceae bacterium]|nr:DUF748 domain-containing protein [Burkholderiaceae bacterium]